MPNLLVTESPIGALRLIERDGALAGVYLPAQRAPDATAARTPLLAEAARQLAAYFAGELRAFDLPLALDASGTAFQRRVWHALRTIPYGETRSYGELARALDTASRAIGAANARNPISIVVPCHRVIATGGALTGYAGGLDAKQWLLAHERGQAARAAGATDPPWPGTCSAVS